MRHRRRLGIATLSGVVAAGLMAVLPGQAMADESSPSPTAGSTSASPAATASATPTESASATASPTPTASATPTATPTASEPTPRTTGPSYLRTTVTVNKGASISVDVAAGSVAVRFTSGVAKKRPVSLQRLVNGAWDHISKKKMDSKGRVTFSVSAYSSGSIYRAVALDYKVKKKRLPLRATKTSGWDLSFSDAFDGTQLDDTKWSLRESANVGPRYCSRTTTDAYSVTGGRFVASADYMKDKDLAWSYHQNTLLVDPAHGCWRGWERSPTGVGVFDTAMITTRDKYSVSTAKPGTVAAKVKLTDAQGMHGAVWLKAPNGGEIDVIEGFGYGRGISNYIHTASKTNLATTGPLSYKLGAYVISDKTKKRSWWANYHTVSISWTSTGFTFRVDGKVTQKVKLPPGDATYELILSQLVSDWEAGRIDHPVPTSQADLVPAKLPEQMSVDWIKVWTQA